MIKQVSVSKLFNNSRQGRFSLSLMISIIIGIIFSHNAIANSEVEATKLPTQSTALATESTRLTVDQSNPYIMVQGAAEQTFKRFAAEQQAIKVNPNLLKDIVREELMPYINYKYSAFKVIGKHLKKTTDAERRAFVPVFREYLVTSYAQVFTLYDNQAVKFSPEKSFTGKRIVAVNTRIIMPGRDNIDVAFKVRLDKKTKKWQAFDMVAEGVSLLDSKQAELGSIIRQKGLPYVTELLKRKSASDIVFKNRTAKDKSTAAKKEQQG
ncbi:phospholipid-binding protein MlaC [Colwellia psychrerythraea]|uniref:Toluene tolerance family protein n=1 Tax=Colwellia psychrerythraea TaxID=28229 RepID=A0A099KPA2_COLPS|nr:ABC transporter substrate-binding protein [Colwellia psychrerythraea]KGJ92331.1 toluene tolerance family protein [Colwellia psychrerythraea]